MSSLKILCFLLAFYVAGLLQSQDQMAADRTFSKKFENLKLTDEQKAKIKAIRTLHRSMVEDRRKENIEFAKNLKIKTQKDIDAVLNETQKTELRDIRELRNEKLAIRRSENQKRREQRMFENQKQKLAILERQEMKIKALQQKVDSLSQRK